VGDLKLLYLTLVELGDDVFGLELEVIIVGRHLSLFDGLELVFFELFDDRVDSYLELGVLDLFSQSDAGVVAYH
jgi:hypothetical protein